MSIEEEIRAAGARLAVAPVSVPDPPRARSRRSGVRSVGIVGSVALIATAIGAAVWLNGTDRGSPGSATSASDCVHAASYELNMDGTSALPIDRITAGTTGSAVWVDAATGTYLTLTVWPSVAATNPVPTGVGQTTPDTSISQGQGRSWFTGPDSGSTRSLGMRWSRNNGELWLLRSFWYGDQGVDVSTARRQLRDWAFAITTARTAPVYRLDTSPMQLVASETASYVASTAYTWTNSADPTATITLGVVENSVAAGRANLLAIGPPQTVLIANCHAWRVTSSNGEIQIGWETGAPGTAWATLIIPAVFAPIADQIISSLQPR